MRFSSFSPNPTDALGAVYGRTPSARLVRAATRAFGAPRLEPTPALLVPAGRYRDVGDAVAAYVRELGDTKARAAWRVVFGCGTVVEAPPEAPEFAGPALGGLDYPEHRVASEQGLYELLAGNRLAWEAQRGTEGEPGGAVRRAYGILAADGYPWPGDARADRDVREGAGVWVTTWPERDPRICNLWGATGGDAAHAVADVTAELRRLDAMSPRAFAVITPGLEVVRLPALGAPAAPASGRPPA